MIWIRMILFSAPLWVIGGAAWFVKQTRDRESLPERRPERSDLVVAIRATEKPGVFNPLIPTTGITREITEMIFDRPFRRDDDLMLRPHLVKAWEFRRKAAFFFTDDSAAEEAADRIEVARDRWAEWGLLDAVREGDEIQVTLSRHDPETPEKLAEIFDSAWLSQMLHVRLTLKDAVRQSFENFLAGSIEKEKIEHFRYDGSRVADLYLTGETDLFLKELRLYYESNRNLKPVIEVLGKESIDSSLELILTLRDDVRWHDGEPFTSDDLVFTWEELARPGSTHPFRKAFTQVDRVEKVNAGVVRVKLRAYDAAMLESWEKLPVLPVHLLRDVHTPEEWRTFFENPIGTGPYAFDTENPNADGEVVLRANRAYYRGAPGQDRIVYRVVEDHETRLLGVRLGQIDVFLPDRRERNWIARDRRVSLIHDVPRFQNFVAWNLDRPLLADRRVRMGLARSIDLDAILAACGGDESLGRCRSLFFPGIWFCEDTLDPVGFDRAAAEVLFAEAGWRKKEDHWHGPDSDGDGPVTFRLTYDRANTLHARLAPRLVEAWQAAGIAVALEAADWHAMIADRLATRDFDALLLGWELGFGRDQHAIWHSSEAVAGGGNLSGLRNQGVDGLLEALRREDDAGTVRKLAGDLQDRIRELQPCLFLCQGSAAPVAFVNDGVRLSRPKRDGETRGFDPVSVGRSGYFASRPWWIRTPAAPNPN